jgi:diguanylate cyclase (GGDEF)-like protein
LAQLDALRERAGVLVRLVETLPIGICQLSADGEAVYSNKQMVALLGPVDSIDELIDSVSGADRRALDIAIEHALLGHPGSLEVTVIHRLGERRCEVTIRTMPSGGGGIDGVIVCASDVTDRSRLRVELERRATYDALSGCLNRTATLGALERALRSAQPVAVAYIDLDNLKAINDELGHSAGDKLLKVAAARLRRAIRIEDHLGRVGGDEFVVICLQDEEPFDPAKLADRLTKAINGEVVFARQRLPLRASVGATVSLLGELDSEAVLHRADTAMYALKRQGRTGPS